MFFRSGALKNVAILDKVAGLVLKNTYGCCFWIFAAANTFLQLNDVYCWQSHRFMKLFCKKGVLGKFASFTGKHLCWSLFFIELQTFSPATILKRDSNTDLFLWSLLNFYENLIWNLRVTASETCSFTWITLCNNLLFRLKLVHCFSFYIINYGFVCQFPFHYNWYSRPDLQSLTLSKITFRQRWFFCEFCEMSHKTFLMNPSDGYFCINTRPVYFPSTTLCLFKNDVTHIFRFSIFST